MSLKENVDYVKEELNSEEKFLEGTVKLERFFKKNKIIIIATVLVIITAVVGISVKNSMDESNKLEANIAFNKLLENPNDKEALKKLKETNIKLYEVANFINERDNGNPKAIKIDYLNSLATYINAVNSNDIQKLNEVSMKNNFILKEFAIFNKALIETKEGKFEEARNTLKLIPNESKVDQLVKILEHHLATK